MSLISNGMTWDELSLSTQSDKNNGKTVFMIIDENLEPITMISLPLIDYSAPLAEWEPVEFQGTWALPSRLKAMPELIELLGQNFDGSFNMTGYHKPEVRYIVAEPPTGGRMIYRVEFSTASGSYEPEILTVAAVSPEAFLLDELPYVNPIAHAELMSKSDSVWSSSYGSAFQWDGLPLFLSNTIGLDRPGQSDTLSGAISRTIDFMGKLSGYDNGPGAPLSVSNPNSIDDSIRVDWDFAPLAEVIKNPAINKGLHLEIQLRYPSDRTMVNDSVYSVSSPQFVFVIRE